MVAGKTKRKAAKDAGYTASMGDKAKAKIEKKPAVQALFLKLLDEAGATDKLLARRMSEGLSATAVVRETAVAKREVLVDFKERREMSQLIGKIRGLIVDKVELDAGPTLAELLEESYCG